jgi:hypothetical protein
MVLINDIVRSGVGGPGGATIGPSGSGSSVGTGSVVAGPAAVDVSGAERSDVDEALASESVPFDLVTARTDVTARIRASPTANSRRLLVFAVTGACWHGCAPVPWQAASDGSLTARAAQL